MSSHSSQSPRVLISAGHSPSDAPSLVRVHARAVGPQAVHVHHPAGRGRRARTGVHFLRAGGHGLVAVAVGKMQPERTGAGLQG